MTTLTIPTLTDEMRATFPAFVDEWTAIGRSTEPCDRDGVIAGIRDAYAAAKLPSPTVFFGVSPVGGAIMREVLARHALGVRAGVGDGVRAGVGDGVRAGVGDGVRAGVWDGVRAGVGAGVWDGVWAGVWAGVWDGVRAGVGDGVRAGVGDGVGDGVRAGVGDGVRAGVWAGVRAGVGDGVWDGVRAGVWDGVGAGVGDGVRAGVRAGVRDGWRRDLFLGCHEASWLSLYDWFRRNGLDGVCAPLDGLTQVAKSAAWTWLHYGFVVASDRPSVLNDERVPGTTHQRRLHCATGPSVRYRDDWELHHWHGQLVPSWVITAPTVDSIAAERNAEIRRCAIESLGWDRYIESLGITPVDECPDPGNGDRTIRLFRLPREHQPYVDDVSMIVVDNGSLDRGGHRRRYALTVPADMPDALTAAAWTYGTTPDLYAAIGRRT